MTITSQLKRVERTCLHHAELSVFGKELRALRQLLKLGDSNAVLSKIRYITEGMLVALCKKHDISWGKKGGLPTLERMIGPLCQHNIIPVRIRFYLRTIQNLSNPGSHFQDEEYHGQLELEDAEYAIRPLLVVLEWYLSEERGVIAVGEEKTARGQWPLIGVIAVGVVLLLSVGGWSTVDRLDVQQFPAEKVEKAQDILEDFRKNLSKRHFKMIQVLQLLSTDSEEEMLEQRWDEYREILEAYNVSRNIYNMDILYFLGREMYLWEREIHFELLYAGRNLECLYRGDGNRDQLIAKAEKHLDKAIGDSQLFAMTVHGLLSGEEAYPVEETRSKEPLDQRLSKPCSARKP